MKCKACAGPKVCWNSTCKNCGYYQHSAMSPAMFNILKVPGNAEKIYDAISKNSEFEVLDCFGKVYRMSKL